MREEHELTYRWLCRILDKMIKKEKIADNQGVVPKLEMAKSFLKGFMEDGAYAWRLEYFISQIINSYTGSFTKGKFTQNREKENYSL